MLPTIIFVSVVIETVVETIDILKEKAGSWKNLVAGVVGAFAAWFFGIDLLTLAGLTPAPAATGVVTTVINVLLFGLVSMRFSGAANSIIEWVEKLGR